MSIRTSTGTIVNVETRDDDRIITLSHPDAPADLQEVEVGRLVTMEGRTGLQVAPMFGFSGVVLPPETLRAIATLAQPEED